MLDGKPGAHLFGRDREPIDHAAFGRDLGIIGDDRH